MNGINYALLALVEQKEYPFYFKGTVILFGLVLCAYVLSSLGSILLPLAFAFIIAILLNPLVNKLRAYKIGDILSILLAMFAGIIIISGIFYFLSSQITRLADNLPALKARFSDLLINVEIWVQQTFGLAINNQMKLINEAINSGKPLIGSTLNTALGTLSLILLIPVYVFLILFYKMLMLNFLFKVFAEQNSKKVADILAQTKVAIQSYMVGLLLETSVVAALNTTALLIIGVKYAVLMGVLGAILNLLPYIGGLIAIALPLLMATVTNDGFLMHFWIIVAYLIIQFIDNNILVPRIVSSKVQINALISIIVVFLGAALWGIGGMFLSIPFVAILKIIFDRIEGLKPWGELLGQEVPTARKSFWLRRPKKNLL